MWLMLQHEKPDDFVVSTGTSHTVQDLVNYVFKSLEIPNWEQLIKQDKRFLRAEELDVLRGDCSKAKQLLSWQHEYTFETMLDEMVEYWLEFYKKN